VAGRAGSPRITTTGSVSVHVPAVHALFRGDTMTTGNVPSGVTGPKPAPFTLEHDQAVTSLGRTARLNATGVLSGHGPPRTAVYPGRCADPRGRRRLPAVAAKSARPVPPSLPGAFRTLRTYDTDANYEGRFSAQILAAERL